MENRLALTVALFERREDVPLDPRCWNIGRIEAKWQRDKGAEGVRISGRAQRCCCAGAQRVQHSWGPLETKFLLRARPVRATRAVRAARREPRAPWGGVLRIERKRAGKRHPGEAAQEGDDGVDAAGRTMQSSGIATRQAA